MPCDAARHCRELPVPQYALKWCCTVLQAPAKGRERPALERAGGDRVVRHSLPEKMYPKGSGYMALLGGMRCGCVGKTLCHMCGVAQCRDLTQANKDAHQHQQRLQSVTTVFALGRHKGKRTLFHAATQSHVKRERCLVKCSPSVSEYNRNAKGTLWIMFVGYIGRTLKRKLGDDGHNQAKNWDTSYPGDWRQTPVNPVGHGWHSGWGAGGGGKIGVGPRGAQLTLRAGEGGGAHWRRT